MDNTDGSVHEKSAINLISVGVPIFPQGKRVGELKKEIIDSQTLYDSVNYIYIEDKQQRLAGVLSIKELLTFPGEKKVEEVMQKNVLTVHPHTHEKKAVHVALKHQIKQIPVVDKQGKLQGVIGSDKLLQIADRELEEDMLRLRGIFSKEFRDVSTLEKTPWHLTRKRLPWLVMGLVGGMFAAQIIGHFEGLLAKEALIISFLPLMVYMSDAVGAQSQTILVRYMSVAGEEKLATYFVKEIITGVLIALVLSLGLGLVSGIIHYPYLGIVLGASLFCTIIFSIIVAILIPWMLIKTKNDPAVGSGPFATIVRDISSILIYFGVSSLLFLLGENFLGM